MSQTLDKALIKSVTKNLIHLNELNNSNNSSMRGFGFNDIVAWAKYDDNQKPQFMGIHFQYAGHTFVIDTDNKLLIQENKDYVFEVEDERIVDIIEQALRLRMKFAEIAA